MYVCREIEKHFWSKFSVKCAPCEIKHFGKLGQVQWFDALY